MNGRTHFSAILLLGLLIGPFEAMAQPADPVATFGISNTRHGPGAEVAFWPVPSVAVLTRGDGVLLGEERAFWLGVRANLLGTEDLKLYLLPAYGWYTCSAASASGTPLGCETPYGWVRAGAVLAGAEFVLDADGRWSLAAEAGRWFVDISDGSQMAFGAILRFRLPRK